MKELIRKILDQKQRQQVRQVLTAFCGCADKMASVFLNVWPALWRVYVKSRLSIIQKMDYGRADVFLDVSSPFEYRVRVKSCAKEPETVAWIESFQKGDVLFDVGANVGAYALLAAQCHQNQVRVYAFEPSFLNFSQLCKNITLNRCHDAVIAFNIALSGKSGLEIFNYHNMMVGGAMHTLGKAIDFKKEVFTPVYRQTVLTYTMDDFIGQFSIPPPQHLKLDVDGIEHEILQGASKTLSDMRLKSILIEMAEDDKEMMETLLAKGFKMHARFPQGGIALRIFNYIFTR